MLEVLISIYRSKIDSSIKNYEELYDFINNFRIYSKENIETILYETRLVGKRKLDDPYWGWWTNKIEKYSNDETESGSWVTAIGHALLCFDYLINDIIQKLKSNKHFDYQNLIQFIKNNTSFNFDFFTLNHDLLLENLFESNQIDYSDGFEAGKFYSDESPIMYHFAANYSSSNRIYKLHGSVNYWDYYYVINSQAIDKHVVIKHKSGEYHSFYINDGSGSQIVAENSGLILSGVESKKLRYSGPLVCDLMPIYKEKLDSADLVIVIGYSFMDAIINTVLDESVFSHNEKPLIAVGFGNAPEYLHTKMLSGTSITFQGDGIDKYNFADAQSLLDRLTQHEL